MRRELGSNLNSFSKKPAGGLFLSKARIYVGTTLLCNSTLAAKVWWAGPSLRLERRARLAARSKGGGDGL